MVSNTCNVVRDFVIFRPSKVSLDPWTHTKSILNKTVLSSKGQGILPSTFSWLLLTPLQKKWWFNAERLDFPKS